MCPGGNRNVSMGYLCDEDWDIYLPYHSYKMHNERLKVTHWGLLPMSPEIKDEDMICYLDRTFCASPNCTNECGRQLTEEMAAKNVNNMPVSRAYFCGEPPSIAESAVAGNHNARAFAEKFMEKNKDLMDRLSKK